MAFVKTAYDISRKKIFFCDTDDSLAVVARKMHMNNIGSILVRNEESVKGIITVNDMLKQIEKNTDQENLKAKDIMSSPVITIKKDIEIDLLVEKFNEHKVSRMVLIDDKNKVVGVVRDIAVYKYLSFYKFDKEAMKAFSRDYIRRLY